MNNMMSALAGSDACPCRSGKVWGQCCAPILSGAQPAPTAEALMRSRYSAYAVGYSDYLAASLHPEQRDDLDLAATRRWAQQAQWLDLQLLGCQAGGVDDVVGEVEFIATFKAHGVIKTHHEKAVFHRYEGVWYYVEGALMKPSTAIHAVPKVGRNAGCPCGSGKKFKKCCGA